MVFITLLICAATAYGCSATVTPVLECASTLTRLETGKAVTLDRWQVHQIIEDSVFHLRRIHWSGS